MRLFALLLALFACSANALVLRAPLRAGAVAPAAAGRAPRVAMRDWREGLARAWPKAGWRALAPLSLLSAPMSGGAKQHPNLSFG